MMYYRATITKHGISKAKPRETFQSKERDTLQQEWIFHEL